MFDAVPVVDAVLLAAGASARMAPHNKLLLTGADGRALIARTLANLRASQVRHIRIVLGHQYIDIGAAIDAQPGEIALCRDHAQGISSSLRAGLRALPGDASAVLICLGDMPAVSPSLIDRLIAAWQPGLIVLPTHGGQRGNPVLWDGAYIPEMLRLEGDQGARVLLTAYASTIRAFPTDDAAVLLDADTPDHVRRLPGGPWRAPDGTPI